MITFVFFTKSSDLSRLGHFLFNDTINNSEYSAFPGRITVTE